MKCDHKICEIEEESSCPIGTASWEEAFIKIECAYDSLFNRYRDLKKECGDVHIEKLRVCEERNTLEIKCDKLEVQRNNWKDLAYTMLVGFIAVCITFIFYVLTHC